MCGKEARDLGDSISLTLVSVLRELTPAHDLVYAVGAFERKNGRWPRNHPELTNFVNQSDGYLMLKSYDRVDFSETPEGDLKIEYVANGRTNSLAFFHKEKHTK